MPYLLCLTNGIFPTIFHTFIPAIPYIQLYNNKFISYKKLDFNYNFLIIQRYIFRKYNWKFPKGPINWPKKPLFSTRLCRKNVSSEAHLDIMYVWENRSHDTRIWGINKRGIYVNNNDTGIKWNKLPELLNDINCGRAY